MQAHTQSRRLQRVYCQPEKPLGALCSHQLSLKIIITNYRTKMRQTLFSCLRKILNFHQFIDSLKWLVFNQWQRSGCIKKEIGIFPVQSDCYLRLNQVQSVELSSVLCVWRKGSKIKKRMSFFFVKFNWNSFYCKMSTVVNNFKVVLTQIRQTPIMTRATIVKIHLKGTGTLNDCDEMCAQPESLKN